MECIMEQLNNTCGINQFESETVRYSTMLSS